MPTPTYETALPARTLRVLHAHDADRCATPCPAWLRPQLEDALAHLRRIVASCETSNDVAGYRPHGPGYRARMRLMEVDAATIPSTLHHAMWDECYPGRATFADLDRARCHAGDVCPTHIDVDPYLHAWWQSPRLRAEHNGELLDPATRCTTPADGDDWFEWISKTPETCVD